MKTMQKLIMMMMVVVMGGMMASCGSDDDDSSVGVYTLQCVLVDQGQLSDYDVQLVNAMLQESETKFPNTTLEIAKAALDQSMKASLSTFAKMPNCTVEFRLKDSTGKVVYSRQLVVKDGQATIK